jgi:hypothetical protein
VGEKSRLRGVATGSRVSVAPTSTAPPQEGQKRAAPETSLPQAEQIMAVAGVYITARYAGGFQNSGKGF